MVLLSFDKATILPRNTCVLLLSHFVHSLPQVADDVELVVHDPRLGGMPSLQGRLAERLPHVHDSQPDSPALLRPEPGEELVQTVLGTVLAAKPDGTSPFEVANHDPIAVMLADGDLVDADDTRGRATSPAELLSHVLLVQFLDGMPIKVQLLGYRLDTTLPP